MREGDAASAGIVMLADRSNSIYSWIQVWVNEYGHGRFNSKNPSLKRSPKVRPTGTQDQRSPSPWQPPRASAKGTSHRDPGSQIPIAAGYLGFKAARGHILESHIAPSIYPSMSNDNNIPSGRIHTSESTPTPTFVASGSASQSAFQSASDHDPAHITALAESPIPSADEIQKQMPEFSKKEIKQFMNAGKNLASRAVLTLFRDTAIANIADPELQKWIRATIDPLIPEKSGSVYCEFGDEFPDFTLVICLGICKRGFVCTIDIPSEKYETDVYQKYDILKRFADTYWRQFALENTDLIAKVGEAAPDVDWNNPKWDNQSHTSFYFDESHPTRVSLYAFYQDKNGTPWVKKASLQ